jgi:hypothetical protein
MQRKCGAGIWRFTKVESKKSAPSIHKSQTAKLCGPNPFEEAEEALKQLSCCLKSGGSSQRLVTLRFLPAGKPA